MLTLLACLPTPPHVTPVDTAVVESPPGDSAPVAPRAVAAGGFFGCVLDGQGALACDGVGPFALTGLELPYDEVGPFIALTAGARHVCALDPFGALQCWGDVQTTGTFDVIDGGLVSQCGLTDGAIACVNDGWDVGHTDVEGDGFVDLSSGLRTTCAWDAAGEVTCWGGADLGQGAPEGPADDLDIGSYVSCVVSPDEELACFGDDLDGLVSDAPDRAQAVSVGAISACALVDGAVSCWGSDVYGVVSNAPDGQGFTAIDVGQGRACALGETAVCWGGEAEPWDHAAEMLDYERDIQPIWSAHCLGCHTGTEGPNGRLSLAPGRSEIQPWMVEAITEGRMPKTSVVPDDQVAVLERYLAR